MEHLGGSTPIIIFSCQRKQAVRKSYGPHAAHGYSVKLQHWEYTERRMPEKKYGPIRLTSARLAHACPNYLILARVLPLVHTVIHYMNNIVMTVLFLSIQNREAGPCVATQQVVCWTVWVAIFSSAHCQKWISLRLETSITVCYTYFMFYYGSLQQLKLWLK